MSIAADAAEAFADAVFDRVPELARMAVAERRKAACWLELRARHRLSTCARPWRRFWRWRMNVHAARCSANKALRSQCAMAAARVRSEVTA